MRRRRRCQEIAVLREELVQLREEVAALRQLHDAERLELDRATLLVQQFRTEPYLSKSLPLETFSVPGAGRVEGYRDQHQPIPPEAATVFFADVFRGDPESTSDAQRGYLELLSGHGPVVDIGCGRGELLDLLREAGMSYAGVDADPGMVARCREHGHEDVSLADANAYLEKTEPNTLGAIISCQVIEHLAWPELERFLGLARRALAADGLLIVETVNPHAVPSFRAFWVDPTHRHPLFPETLLALCRIAGFPSAYAFHPGGSGDVAQDRYIAGAYAVLAHAPH